MTWDAPLARPPVPSALPDSVARSAALLEAAGFAVIEPMHPIRDVVDDLARRGRMRARRA